MGYFYSIKVFLKSREDSERENTLCSDVVEYLPIVLKRSTDSRQVQIRLGKHLLIVRTDKPEIVCPQEHCLYNCRYFYDCKASIRKC